MAITSQGFLKNKVPKLPGVVNYIMYRGHNGMLSMSRSLQDHLAPKISNSTKSARFHPVATGSSGQLYKVLKILSVKYCK